MTSEKSSMFLLRFDDVIIRVSRENLLPFLQTEFPSLTAFERKSVPELNRLVQKSDRSRLINFLETNLECNITSESKEIIKSVIPQLQEADIDDSNPQTSTDFSDIQPKNIQSPPVSSQPFFDQPMGAIPRITDPSKMTVQEITDELSRVYNLGYNFKTQKHAAAYLRDLRTGLITPRYPTATTIQTTTTHPASTWTTTFQHVIPQVTSTADMRVNFDKPLISLPDFSESTATSCYNDPQSTLGTFTRNVNMHTNTNTTTTYNAHPISHTWMTENLGSQHQLGNNNQSATFVSNSAQNLALPKCNQFIPTSANFSHHQANIPTPAARHTVPQAQIDPPINQYWLTQDRNQERQNRRHLSPDPISTSRNQFQSDHNTSGRSNAYSVNQMHNIYHTGSLRPPKIDLPTFKKEGAMEWLDTFEMLMANYPDETKISCLVACLAKENSEWLQNHVRDIKSGDWETVRSLFTFFQDKRKDHFTEQEKFNKTSQETTETGLDYVEKKLKMSKNLKHPPPQAEIIKSVITGLNPTLRLPVYNQNPKTYLELRLAVKKAQDDSHIIQSGSLMQYLSAKSESDKSLNSVIDNLLSEKLKSLGVGTNKQVNMVTFEDEKLSGRRRSRRDDYERDYPNRKTRDSSFRRRSYSRDRSSSTPRYRDYSRDRYYNTDQRNYDGQDRISRYHGRDFTPTYRNRDRSASYHSRDIETRRHERDISPRYHSRERQRYHSRERPRYHSRERQRYHSRERPRYHSRETPRYHSRDRSRYHSQERPRYHSRDRVNDNHRNGDGNFSRNPGGEKMPETQKFDSKN